MKPNTYVKMRIRQAMAEHDIAARAWSERAGLGPNHVAQFLNGDENRSITIQSLGMLGKVIGWSVVDFLEPRASPGVDQSLLQKIVELTIETLPDPAPCPDHIAQVIASTYAKASDFGLSADDHQQILFGLQFQSHQ